MLKAPKTLAGSMARKTTALLVAYSFLATSVWSLNPSRETFPGTSHRVSLNALRGPLANWLAANASRRYSTPANGAAIQPNIVNNLAALNAPAAMAQSGGSSTTIDFFGPQEYVRTTGAPNTYTTTVQVPAWVVNPFNLHIQNGEADGSFRVSSATITVNNVQVAGPLDFNQQVFTLDRSVTLTPTTTLVVTLASKPGSYLRINLAGANADHTPPKVTIASPAANINTPLAHFDIQYQDLPGPGEPAASGVNTSTLKVLIDGVDRTSLFTKRTDDATADLPSSLALSQGLHNVTASIQDNAGNIGQATLNFAVNATAPTLQIQQPSANSFLNSNAPQVVLVYGGSIPLNLASLKVTDNGVDITSSLTKTATGASGTAPPLSQGGNTIVASISDQAGNQATTSVSFNVDTTAPTITIVHPVSGSVHGSANVEYLIQYSDDQALDPTSVVVTVDGSTVAVTPGASSVSGSISLGNSTSHVLAASIKDKAGNPATSSSTFTVDTTFPNVHIVQPVNNAALNNNTPAFQVQYSESISGVDPNTFRASVDGTDVTGLFNPGASSASATLQTPLADGFHTFSAQIASAAGNVGQASNQVLIDTVKPQLTILSPTGAVNTTTPVGVAQYSDAGSGIDPASVRVSLDGVDVTGTFGIGSSSATGALGSGAGLSEGTHQFAITVADKAGNVAQASSSFLVDVTPPTASFTTPANNSFINNPQPTITLAYSDSGSGVDTNSIHVFLQQGTAAETEITALFAFGIAQGTATIPATSPLAPGTYHLRAVLSDKAGNQATPLAAFAIDTTPPTYTIVAPAANAFLNTATPTFTVNYQDDSSGVDTSKFALLVDGVDRTNRLTVTASGASGTLQPGDALSDGTHQVVVTVIDLAGNAAAQVPQSFLVDTTPPAIAVTAPAASSFTSQNQTAITVTYSDSGSGIDVTTFQLLIDGTDHTAELTVSATGASGTLASALLDGAHNITANIKDLAGNPAAATALFTVDTTPPSIVPIITPAPNAAGWNNTNVVVSFTCSDSGSGVATCSPPVNVNTEGAGQVVSGQAVDKAGNTSHASVTLNIDKTPPVIAAAALPPANGAGWNNTPVVISYVCSDALSGIAVCPPSNTVSSEGANQNISAQATDQAGNTATVSTILSIDMTPPVVTVTAAPPPNAAGWNNSNVTVSFACADNLSGVATCPTQQFVAGEGQNHNISGQATDVAGNKATGAITLNIDKTPPTIVQISTPDHISTLHPGQVSVIVNDNFTVAQVTISVNGTSLGTFTTPPYQTALTVPAGANPGDTLNVTVVATDQAGNTQTASRGVSVAAEGGVVVGQVIDDATGLPVSKAVVQTSSSTGLSDLTDDQGRYSLQVSDAHVFLSVSKTTPATQSAPATSTGTVEREVFVQSGVGTVPVDARLTTLAAQTSIGSAGGTLSAGAISISVPVASVSDGTTFQLTPLSGQGLPNLLPLGWSPLAAFDLRSSAAASNLGASVANLSNVVMHAVTYSPGLHAWTMVATNLQAVNGAVNFSVPGTGAYALVVPDAATPPIPIPALGASLTGLPVQALDPAVTGSGSLNPPILPAGGGTSTATLTLQSPNFAPSGTIVQANVSERFSLASGDVVEEQIRSEDIVVYNALTSTGAAQTMSAQFPVTPSHQYSNTQLVSGNVHLDILAGREGVRGQPGGNDPLTVSDGVATLAVPGGALGQDTAIVVQSTTLEDFVPTSSSMGAIQEVIVDFSGETLNTPAQLSISASSLNPNDTFLLTLVQRINGVPHMVAVAVAQINGTNLTTIAFPGLPGVVQGGEYVFYDISAPVGFVQGVATSAAGPVQALVQTDSLQIVSITGTGGQYMVPALAGTVNLKANGTNSLVAGAASAQLAARQTAVVNIQLAGSVNTAVVSPADGSLGVPPSTIITITTPVPISPASIQQGNLALFKGTPASPGAPVPVQFALSVSGTVLTLTPANNLDPATQYTVQVSGLADGGGGAIVVPTSTFTTKSAAALNFDPNQITFGFPDQNGNIHVSAPAGSLAPGTNVMIVDQSSGAVLSLTALNDGSLSGDFLGTINDFLQITVTDPNGATVNFTRSQFVAADGTTAVGAGGGTVTGPGGVEMRIPPGALNKAASFKIESFGPALFPDQPNLPGGTFGSGIKISSPDIPTFKQEVKLAFPYPAGAPAGSFFHVYRRWPGPNNQVAYESLDHAFVEGSGASAKVVMASFPFSGYANSFDGYSLGGPLGGAAVQGGLDNYAIVMWTFDQTRPGIALGGAITGRVRYEVVPGAQMPDGSLNPGPGPVFVPVANAIVSVDVNDSTHQLLNVATTATSQADGSFTFADPNYRGGTVKVTAEAPSGIGSATAFEAVGPLTDKTLTVYAGPLLPSYRNVAFADIFVPAPVLPPPTPTIQARLFTLDQNNLRQDAPAVIQDGTPLVIAFKTDGTIVSLTATINGQPFAVQPDTPDNPADPTKLDFSLTQHFVPNGAGNYVINMVGQTAFGQTTNAGKPFLVVGAGGSNNAIIPGAAPTIISTTPEAGAQNVPVETFVQVLFSEPVTNLPGHVSLVPDDGSTPPSLALSGINYKDGSVITNLGPADAVASLTLQPTGGLKFGTHYTLTFTSDVVDLDNTLDPTQPAHSLNVGSAIGFTTFGPKFLGGTTSFSSTRPVTLGDRLFVARPLNAALAAVDEFDISDPTALNGFDFGNPTTPPLLVEANFVGRAQDIAAEQSVNALNGRNLIVAAAGVGATAFGLPSNLWFYDATDPGLARVGVVSATSSTVNVGQVLRVTLNGDLAYTSTFPLGIQVIDLATAFNEYQTFQAINPTIIGQQSTTDGQGFANDAVVNVIPVKDSAQRNVFLRDIKASDFLVRDPSSGTTITKTFVVAAGFAPGLPGPPPVPFVVADPQLSGASAVQFAGALQLGAGSLTSGTAVALGRLTDSVPDASGNLPQKQVAVAVGTGTTADPANPGQQVNGPVLAVVDLTNPPSPVTLSILSLSAFPTDIVLNGTTAIIGTAQNEVLLVDLIDPRKPVNAGTIQATSFGDRLALSESGLLISSSFDGTHGGLQIATVGKVAYITGVTPDPITVSAKGQVVDDVQLAYRLVPPSSNVHSAQIQINVQNLSTTGTATLINGAVDQNGLGTVTWQQGTFVDTRKAYTAQVFAADRNVPYGHPAHRLHFNKVPLLVTMHDRLLKIQLALPSQGLFTEKQYGVKVYVTQIGSPYPSDPQLDLKSSDIQNAYPNKDVWYQAVDLSAAFVARKIDSFAMPPGTDTAIPMQSFEIGSILSGYAQVKVVVTGNFTHADLATFEGAALVDGQWAPAITKIEDKIKFAAGLATFTLSSSTPPQPGFFNPTNPFDALSTLGYRVAVEVEAAAAIYGMEFVNGLLDGFHDALEGDLQLLGALDLGLFDLLTHPIDTSKAIAGWIRETYTNLSNASFKAILQQVWGTISNNFATAPVYFTGYTLGYLAEAALLTKGLGAVSDGLKGFGAFLRSFPWVAALEAKTLAAIRDFGLGLLELSKLGVAIDVLRQFRFKMAQIADQALEFGARYVITKRQQIWSALIALWIANDARLAPVLHWLGTIAEMTSDAATRFVTFIQVQATNIGDQLMARWLNFTNGSRAIRDAFQAYDRIAQIASDAVDALVVAADRVNTQTVDFVSQYVAKFRATPLGDRVESTLLRLVQFQDQVKASAIKIMALADVAALSEDAVQGIANFMNQIFTEFGLSDLETMMEELASADQNGAEATLDYLKDSQHDVVRGVADTLEAAPCPLVTARLP